MVVSRAPAPDSARQMMIWLFPLIFCLGSGNEVSRNSTRRTVMNGVLGESITLPLELPAGTKAIVWHYVGEASNYVGKVSHVTIILIIQLNKSENPHIMKTDPEWGKRLHITQSYALQVSNLTMADTGSYTAQIITEDSPPDFIIYILRVFERLSNLEVTNHTRVFENGTCEIHLTCIVENPNHTVSVGWQASGSTSLREPNLTVSWDPKNSNDQSYTCQAENAVSNLSISVSAQSLCTDCKCLESGAPGCRGSREGGHNLCLHLQRLGGRTEVLREEQARNNCFGDKKKCSGDKKDPRSCRKQPHSPTTDSHLYLSVLTIDSSQNTDTPGSPGNTVYAQVTHPVQEMEIPKSVKNDSMTIYSIVNHSRQPISPRMDTLKDIK
ncbi:SLAM family member 6 [Peromyscus eremicus]|uniref:SLAM family member 6 n=1 Tax=Peromyscus eremicus TaxID=42410 RepID=UPI0027DCC08A|nr:SLAM family member 6 [Peromyscus eremicus]